MSEIFSETNMRHVLEKYIPDGETLLAGIHAAANGSNITGVFGKCIRTESRLLPDENGGTITLNKKKYSGYDVYIGITQHYLVIADCEKYDHFYQFDDEPKVIETEIQVVTSPILLEDIGTCFPLTDIKSCETKKDGWLCKMLPYHAERKLFQAHVPKAWRAGRGNAPSYGVPRGHYRTSVPR